MTGAAPPAQSLRFFSLVALGINGVVGVGIFFVPASVAALVPGDAGVLVYLLTALALLPVAVVYARLGAAYREDGGPYVWARAAFGPGTAFGVGWIAWISAVFSTSAVVVGLTQHLATAIPDAPNGTWRALAGALLLALGGVAALGLRPSAVVWNGITILKLLPLVGLAGLGALVTPSTAAAAVAPSSDAFVRAMLLAVFALQGFEIVPVPAGKAREARHVTAATLGSLLVAAALYVALHHACVRALPALGTGNGPLAPLAAAARVHAGSAGERVVQFGTTLSALGIAFGMIVMSPRYLAALGRSDGLGIWLGREGPRGVPGPALAITLATTAAVTLSGELTELFVISSVAVLTQYAVSTAALLRLALASRQGLRPAQAWPVPLAIGAIALVGPSAKPRELRAVLLALAMGGILLLLCRALRRCARPARVR